ncbi:MAG: 2-oxo acid dehydrogenase subunit E2 [Spirochaetales bacterium]|nr:2-oxo acid dehydrogenase subunit E2 [Spirochaetales bacterium]
MAEQIILPRQGQSVETCLILNWRKHEGDEVALGEVLVDVETDKAAFEVESTAAGTLLKILHQEGDDVPVLTPLAIVGQPGEDVDALIGTAEGSAAQAESQAAAGAPSPQAAQPAASPAAAAKKIPISPRARRAAENSGLTPAQVLAALPEGEGSGPRGRILERDVRQAAAKAGAAAPAEGAAQAAGADAARANIAAADYPGPVREVPVKGIRKVIAERMHASLQGSAQYTIHASACAEALLAYRKKLKDSAEELGLRDVTINDLLNYAVSRVLLRFPAVNSHFVGDRSLQFERVHLAVAVDTPRGLMVPVIRNASGLSLKRITAEAARLRRACLESTVQPEELNGGTFTVSNMGTMGVEGFTPVLNPPQVAILGVGSLQLKPVERGQGVVFERFMGLSLTANHQILDGAPAAAFLADLRRSLESFELLLAG